MLKTKAIYNKIGKTYDLTRKADPTITKQLINLLQVEPNQKYLDLGCGTGNYTASLTAANIDIEGIDISD